MKSKTSLAALVALVLFAVPAFAQEERTPPQDAPVKVTGETPAATPDATNGDKKDPKKEEKVKTGIIANTGNFGFGPQVIDSDGGGSAPGEEASVITGSVSPASNGKCMVSIMNASKENTYTARYSVMGTNARGVKVMNKSFTNAVKPGSTEKREVPCQDGLNMSLELRSATKR